MARRTFYFIVAASSLAVACSTKDQSSHESKALAGAYARETSFTVIKQETGEQVGKRTIRDTIFIASANEGFEISNEKWMLNDYDLEGWRNMRHSDDRPFQRHSAILNSAKAALESDGFPPIHININGLEISLSDRTRIYKKVK
jgi:hypothetical protein